jgi:hypothetical protein
MKPNLRLAALIVIAVIVLIGLAHTALAAGNCGERKAVEAELAAEFAFRYSSRIANGPDDRVRADLALIAVKGKRLKYHGPHQALERL